jgi:hypothetical protein
MSTGLFLLSGDWHQICAWGGEWKGQPARSSRRELRAELSVGQVYEVGAAAAGLNVRSNQTGAPAARRLQLRCPVGT